MAWSTTARTGVIETLRAALVGCSRTKGQSGWSGLSCQVALMIPPALLYFLVRDLSADQEQEAFANASAIVDLQRSLGLDWEATLQQRILDIDWVLAAVNWIYIYGHFPLIFTSLVLLFGLSRTQFVNLRNSLVASGVIGLVCFALYPVAPPRLFAPDQFFDSLAELSSSYQILQNPEMTNQFAAVPSFHVGWNLLVAIAIFRASRHLVIRAATVVFPFLMMTAVVLTANHWLLDVAAGIAVAGIGIVGAKFMDRFFRWLQPSSTTTISLIETQRPPIPSAPAAPAHALHVDEPVLN